jgi:hypothetical protein
LSDHRALAFDSKLIIVLSDIIIVNALRNSFLLIFMILIFKLGVRQKHRAITVLDLRSPIPESETNTQGGHKAAIGTQKLWKLAQPRLLVTSLVADIPNMPAWYDASCRSLQSLAKYAFSIIVNQTISLNFILKVLNIFWRRQPRSCQNILNQIQ